jgi:hypothetical protein
LTNIVAQIWLLRKVPRRCTCNVQQKGICQQ